MIFFGKEQIKMMRLLQQEQFVSRLVRYLTRSYGDRLESVQQDALRLLVKNVTNIAPKWGFYYESEIAEIAMLILEMKIIIGYQRMPEWFSEIVLDDKLNPHCKLYRLIQRWKIELAKLVAANIQ